MSGATWIACSSQSWGITCCSRHFPLLSQRWPMRARSRAFEEIPVHVPKMIAFNFKLIRSISILGLPNHLINLFFKISTKPAPCQAKIARTVEKLHYQQNFYMLLSFHQQCKSFLVVSTIILTQQKTPHILPAAHLSKRQALTTNCFKNKILC